jgi:tetratricopeptide (TPR) repeat protein
MEVREQSPRNRPEYIYTDTLGRFEFQGRPNVIHVIRVESDGETYAETIVDFIPSGVSPFVHVYLRQLQKGEAPSPEDSVTSPSVLQQVPRNARREFERGVNFMRQNRPAEARAKFEKAIELFPDYVEARNELAVLLMRQNQLAAAESHLLRALAVDSAAPNALLNLGLCLVRQNRADQALPHLERAIQLRPTNAAAHLLYGAALLMDGKDDLAESVLLRAYELGGKQVSQAQYHLARIYDKRNDLVRAARALEIYLNDTPDDPNAAQLREMLAQWHRAIKQQETNQPRF